MRYRAPRADALVAVELDTLTALYHRPSGITPLLAAPAPEIIAALTEPMTCTELMTALTRDYDLTDPDEAALAARLDELVASGLLSTA
jgi:PqqD family protein of HPr-rel-A system